MSVTDAEAIKLRGVLSRIGKNEMLRAQFLAACRLVESLPENAYTTPRAELTGPIVDALHEQITTVRKELSNGIIFDFYYRSHIARDFVMSVPEKPDHVWEPQTTRLLLHLARGAANVVVGGAYFGDHAILLANQLREDGGVCHAFDPDGDQLAMLEHNARLNNLDNIRANPLGLWSDNTSRLRLTGHDALASARAVPRGQAQENPGELTFPTTTVDRYLDEQGIERVELIMLDIEGAELNALRGAEGQLTLAPGRAPNLVFEVHRSYVDWTGGLQNTEPLKYLSSFGYTMFAVRDFQSNYDMRGRPIEIIPAESAYLEGPPHGFNMLAVKNTSIVDDRFKVCYGVSPKLLLHRDPALHHPTDGL